VNLGHPATLPLVVGGEDPVGDILLVLVDVVDAGAVDVPRPPRGEVIAVLVLIKQVEIEPGAGPPFVVVT
jgi:hypothetical protein